MPRVYARLGSTNQASAPVSTTIGTCGDSWPPTRRRRRRRRRRRTRRYGRAMSPGRRAYSALSSRPGRAIPPRSSRGARDLGQRESRVGRFDLALSHRFLGALALTHDLLVRAEAKDDPEPLPTFRAAHEVDRGGRVGHGIPLRWIRAKAERGRKQSTMGHTSDSGSILPALPRNAWLDVRRRTLLGDGKPLDPHGSLQASEEP